MYLVYFRTYNVDTGESINKNICFTLDENQAKRVCEKLSDGKGPFYKAYRCETSTILTDYTWEVCHCGEEHGLSRSGYLFYEKILYVDEVDK